MHFLARLFPDNASGENPFAVKMFYVMTSVKAFFQKIRKAPETWPVYSGNYTLINPMGEVAVCSLTSDLLWPKEDLPPNMAIIGTVVTPNLGIERMISNIVTNQNIRYLLICGKDSPIFKAGEAIEYLLANGVDEKKRIIQASGHYPVLSNLNSNVIQQFRDQVQLINLKGEKDIAAIHQKVKSLKSGHIAPVAITLSKEEHMEKALFIPLKPGYLIEGHAAESILLAILEKGLVSQLSHAGYLGSELSKAEAALRHNFIYTQDQSLKSNKEK